MEDERTLVTDLSVVSLIKGGKADDDLDAVMEAVHWRKRVLASRLFDDLEPDDRVRVIDNIKPRYLAGATATVVAKRVSKVTIRFDDDIHDPYNKWAGRNCILSPGMIEKVED